MHTATCVEVPQLAVAGPSDHPTRPAVRLDVMGLLLLVQGGEVIALTGTALRSGGPAEQSSDFPGPLQATSFCRRPLMSEVCMTLIPYDRRKGIPLNVAAERAGKSPGTIRN